MGKLVDWPRRWPRHVRIWLPALILILIGIRLALPPVVLHEVNKKLNEAPDYRGHVQSVGIHLWRGAYSLNGIVIRKRSGQISQPFLSARQIDFSVSWIDLFQGHLVSSFYIESPEITFVKGPVPAESQLKVSRSWQDVLKSLFPIRITRLRMTDGTIHFIDTTAKPTVDVYVRHMLLEAYGLQNRPPKRRRGEFPATIALQGTTIGKGKLTINIQADPLADQPHFYLTVTLQNVELTALNQFLHAYGDVEVSAGDFQLYVELGANHGEIQGYIKPFFQDVSYNNPANIKHGPLRAAWDAVVAGLTELLKNKKQNQVGTRVPIAGAFGNYRPDTLTALGNLIRNGFVKALPSRIEGTVNPEAIAPPQKGS